MVKHRLNKAVGIVLAIVQILSTTTLPQTQSWSVDGSVSGQFNCPDTDQCHCARVISEYEIQCPHYDPLVTIKVHPGSFIYLHCIGAQDNVYASIPTLNVGKIEQLQLQGCPLPAGRSLSAVAEKFNATNIRTLRYQVYGHIDNPQLRRQHFSGFKDLQRLLYTDSSQTEFPPDLFDDLEGLNWLHLKSSREYLPVGIFKNLPNLQYLELHMQLQKIDDGLLANQKSLIRLSLWNNQLHNLTKDSFKDVVSIRELDLGVNNIQHFDPEVFNHLVNLENINLNANNFSSLPENLFVNNLNLKEIRLMDNRQPIETFPPRLFANLTQLTSLSIRVGVQYLPEDLLQGSSNLTNLQMERNQLSTLPPRFLEDQVYLDQLNLQFNNLSALDDRLFANTRNLKFLRLSHNKLRVISADLFANLGRLEELYLDQNNIETIDQNAFHGLTSLLLLDLQHNYLSFSSQYTLSIPSQSSPFSSLTKLEKLYLQHNKIETIFEDLSFNNVQLKELDLSFNSITGLSWRDLQFVQNSITVNLTNNQISQIDMIDLELIAVNTTKEEPSKIYLGSNPLSCDCFAFALFDFTTKRERVQNFIDFKLDDLICSRPMPLRGKRLIDLHPFNLTCALDTDMTQKKLCPESCDCSVRVADRAILVNCSSVGLVKVPELPDPANVGLVHIELDLTNNHITRLPSTADQPGFNKVSLLMLDNNNISYLGVDSIPEKIKVLQLTNNQLKYFNSTIYDYLNQSKSLERLTLAGNTWQCDCSTTEFLSFVQNSYAKIADLSQVTCSNGEFVQLMSRTEFCPTDNLPIVLMSIILALFGVFVACAALLYMKYAQEIKVWLFAKGWCLWLIGEDDLDEDKKYDAFVSYSSQDEELVRDHLLPMLETGDFPYKLCIHERDWIPGHMISDQYRKSIAESRKTIVILSKNFLQSEWGRAEFREANQTAMKECRARVILILYGDLGPLENLDEDFKAYISTNTYLAWEDQWFWRKLRYALRYPISMRETRKGRKGLVKNAIKNSVDDKLELIIPSPVTPTLTTPPAEHANNTLVSKLNATNAKHLNGGAGINGGVVSHNGNNGKIPNGGGNGVNGGVLNGHVNGAFIINTNAKQSDV